MDLGDIDWGGLSDADWGDMLGSSPVGDFDWSKILNGIDVNNMTDADWADIMNGTGATNLGDVTGGNPAGDLGGSDGGNMPSGSGAPSDGSSGHSSGGGLNLPGGTSGLGGLPAGLSSLLGNGGSALLGLLAPALGAYLSSSATKKATDQTVAGINKASDQITGILGGPNGYAPYMQTGQQALTKLNGMNYQPLSPQFKALGPGRGMTTLGQLGRGR